MVLNHTYIPTNYKTRVSLLPHEIQKGKIDDFILQRLKAKYEGYTIKDGQVLGYIRPGSLKLVDKTRAFITGSHFTGTLTYTVVIRFDLYTPVLGKEVIARVIKMTPIGFTAEASPLRIIVAKTATFEQPNELFANIEPDLEIPIEILHYNLKGDYIFAVGRLRPFQENYSKSYKFEIDTGLKVDSSDAFADLRPAFEYQVTVPKQNDAYGNPAELNAAKDKLSDPDDPSRVSYWKYYMKQFLNDYEIIGNNHYYPNDQIFNLTVMPFNRAYYKLIEILKDDQVLTDFEDLSSINALLLGEAPGGFIQALIDARQGYIDDITAVTAPKNAQNGVMWDWDPKGNNVPYNLKKAKEYLDNQSNVKRVTKDLTLPSNIENIIETFKDNKVNLITADGGIDVEENDNYNFQESMNYKLFYSEILTAIGCQADEGHFIIKIYDIYTNVTNQLLHLLANLYSSVTIIKPKTSRPANSERYVVCKYFKGLHGFPLNAHLEQLAAWNTADEERKIMVTSPPFLDRKFYVTSLVVINLDPEMTLKIKEKNQLFVKRQIDTINKGTETLNKLLFSSEESSDKDKEDHKENRETIKNRMTTQIQNAILWCKDYLPSNSCKPMPNSTDIKYYETAQGGVGPLIAPIREKKKRDTETSTAESQKSLTRKLVPVSNRGRGSSSGISARGRGRGRGRGSSIVSSRGTTRDSASNSDASSSDIVTDNNDDNDNDLDDKL